MTIFIFGLDGASFENIGEAMKRTELPNFRKLLSGGTTCELLSTFPYVTGPAWASMFSGSNPGKHGIFDLYGYEDGKIKVPNMRSCDIPFLWDYLTWAGKKTLVIGVPFISPAPTINGIFINGRFSSKLSFYPENLGDLFDLSAFHYNDIPSIGEEAVDNIIRQGPRDLSERMIDDLRKRASTSLKIVDSSKWDVVILVDSLPDEIFHISLDDPQIVDAMFRELDKWLGEIFVRMKEHDKLIVVSDHGFSPIRNVFFLNEWLKTKGYLTTKDSNITRLLFSLGVNFDSLTQPGLINSVYKFALRRFPGFLSLLKNKARGGVVTDNLHPNEGSKVVAHSVNEPVAWLEILRQEDRDVLVKRLLRDLKSLKQDGILKRAFRTEDIYYGKYLSKALGQVIIEAEEGLTIDTLRLNGGKIVGKQLFTNKGAHRRAGVFVMYGDNNYENAVGARALIYDIVPTVLSMMKLPIPPYLDGKPMVSSRESIPKELEARRIPTP